MDPVMIFVLVDLIMVGCLFIGYWLARSRGYARDYNSIQSIQGRRLLAKAGLDHASKLINEFTHLMNESEPQLVPVTLEFYKSWEQTILEYAGLFESLERELLTKLMVKNYSFLESNYRKVEDEMDRLMSVIVSKIRFLEDVKKAKGKAGLVAKVAATP